MRTSASSSPDTAAASGPSIKIGGQPRRLMTRRDGIDFRDQMYIPTLFEVPPRRELARFRKVEVPVLDQGTEGACTGFGLATVANFLLATRSQDPDRSPVSAHMFYDMARRYDEWAGIDYEGSSCRGAIKGWFKHGVCAADHWQHSGQAIGALTETIVSDAARRPLGAYFRVNHKSLVAMHSAISEVGILYASATVHRGWSEVDKTGQIRHDPEILGGHAFAIVGYDETGFWIQNSWGGKWGRDGCGHLSYQDWLANGSDVWVARLGAPVVFSGLEERGMHSVGAVRSSSFLYNEIRPHVISIKNDGQLDEHGDVGTSAEMVRKILREDFTRITADWPVKRIVLYAHGGLTSKESALQRVSEARQGMLDAHCYPLSFVWKSDYLSTLKNILVDSMRKRRPEGALDNLKDFMLDRVDDMLEPLARQLTGKAEWDEMKENALMATTTARGGARIVADELAKLAADLGEQLEIHLVGHSAGAIFHAPLVQYLSSEEDLDDGPLAHSKAKGKGLHLKSCTLWAPACSSALFKQTYLPAIRDKRIGKFTLFTLTDKAEQDDNCASLYNKSLLYLVSNAFEDKPRNPFLGADGEPIVGMQKFVEGDPELHALFRNGKADWVLAPNTEPPGSPKESRAMHHGDFDDNEETRRATLSRILDAKTPVEFTFARSKRSQCHVRRDIDALTKGQDARG